MSKPKHCLRGKGAYMSYGYSAHELNAEKGSMSYRFNLQEARQAEIKKAYFSQPALSMKITGVKFERLVKLARYQAFVDRGTK